jgi:hypothetical protein
MTMPTRKTVILVDDGQIKVIYGDKLKCIRFADAGLPHNLAFLDALGASTTLVNVDQVSVVSPHELAEILGDLEAAPRKARDPEVSLPETMIAIPKRGDAQRPQPRPRAPLPPTKEFFAPADGGDIFIKSNSQTTIIIDDLYTNTVIARPGMAPQKQALALEPGKPVNMAGLDQESVQKSRILAKLLASGLVMQIPHDEATEMLAQHEKRQASVISAKDMTSSLVPDGMSAASYAQRARHGELPDDDVQSIDISESDRMPSVVTNEVSGSMEKLMASLAETDGQQDAPEQPRTYRR